MAFKDNGSIKPFERKVWSERYNWGNQEKTLIFQGF